MKEWLIKHLILWLASLTTDHWEAALEAVRVAALRYTQLTGEQRKQYVIDTLKLSWPALSAGALNLLIELAYAFAKRRGYLNP
jgi:hypothetical protein